MIVIAGVCGGIGRGASGEGETTEAERTKRERDAHQHRARGPHRLHSDSAASAPRAYELQTNSLWFLIENGPIKSNSCGRASRTFRAMEEVHQLLLIVGLACGRFILTLVDCIAAIQYPTCAHACNVPLPTRTECQGLLSSAAILNLFEVCALGLFFYLRYESGSWSYREYYRASLLLIAASLLLRLAAVCLPLAASWRCFPPTTAQNLIASCGANRTESDAACAMEGFFSAFAAYCAARVALCLVDIGVYTPWQLRMAHAWYHDPTTVPATLKRYIRDVTGGVSSLSKLKDMVREGERRARRHFGE